MSELSSRGKKGKVTLSIVAFLVLLLGACTWVLARPKAPQNTPIADIITWSAQQAAADTDLLITVDSSHLPQKELTDADVAKMQKAISSLSKTFHVSIDLGKDLTAKDMQWLIPQAALLGRFESDDHPTELVLLLRTNNESAAQHFLDKHMTSLPSKVENGCAYIASTQAALESVLSSKKYTLSTHVAFVDARQKVRYARNSFVYCDLSRVAPKFAAHLDKMLHEGFKDESASLNTADLVALISSVRYLVGGEDYVEGNLLGECFLIADVANSGKLGQIVFNPNYNIAHPALAQRSASSQSCVASNVKYNYAIMYELLGIHPFTEAVRDYPDYILSSVDLSMDNDIFGSLLSGSLVASIENFDYNKVIELTQKTVAQVPAAKMQANKTSAKESAKDDEAKLQKDGSVAVSGPSSDAVKGFMELLRAADWRLSLDLQNRAALESIAAKVPFFQELINGVFAQDGSAKNTPAEADAERWGFLPASKVIDNTIWMASQATNCGPIDPNAPTIGQLACWKTLDKMSVSHNAVFEWSVSVQAMQAKNALRKNSGLTDLTTMWHERGDRQCGRLTVTPDGLHFCEVMEVNLEK